MGRALLTASLLLWAAVQAAGAPLDLYVAPTGSDRNAGTKARPFATLEGARDALRTRRQAHGLPREGVRVWVRPGVYRLSRTFALDARDSGTAAGRVTYAAEQPGAARLVGGCPLRPDGFRPVADPAILARLPEESRGKVLQADLRAQGIADFGEMRPRGFSHPYVNPGLELFFRGKAMPLARWPNRGAVPIGKVLDAGSVPRDGDNSGRGARFTYDFDRPQRWRQAGDIWLSGLFHYGFADDTLPVRSIDTEKHEIELALPHLYGVASGRAWQAYHALNLLEEIDEPGEWYLDRKAGILYFLPPAPIAAGDAWVSLLDTPMVALENASYVTLQGFTLEVSRGMGVYIEGGTEDLVAGCTLRNLGTVAVCLGQGVKSAPAQMTWGIAAEKGLPLPPATPVSGELGDIWDYIYGNTLWNRNAGTHHTILSCDIYDTGAGGIVLGGGDRATLAPGNNAVLNCHIHDFNRLDRAYRSAVMVDGVGNRIAHNLIHDAPHNAILLHGNDHVIELNEIYRVCRTVDDMGAFYMGRDPSEQGNVVRFNFFHHNGSGSGGSCAVYLDDGSCGTSVIGNVFYRQRGQPVWINGGHGHVFRNNVFVENGGASIGQGMDNAAWVNFVKDPLQVRRLRQSLDVTRPPYAGRYPDLDTVFDADPKTRRGQTVERNLSVRSGDFGGGRNEVKDNWVTGEDPGFADAAAMDFTLKPAAEALRHLPGFQPIPFHSIGLTRDQYRRTLPARAAAEKPRSRDPKRRAFACRFDGLAPGDLAGQGEWGEFGPGPGVCVGAGTKTAGFDPGTAALAEGEDSWATIGHGIILDGSRDITLEMEAFLPAPLPQHASFELYLNRGALHVTPAFGFALVGGAEGAGPDCIGARADAGGPRLLTGEHLAPGHWYRIRLQVPAGTQSGRLSLQDLTAGETALRPVPFAGGKPSARLPQGDAWHPPLSDLDTLVLRLGGGAQVRGVSLANR